MSIAPRSDPGIVAAARSSNARSVSEPGEVARTSPAKGAGPGTEITPRRGIAYGR